ncbi:disease resistance protein RGA2-like [Cucumis melo var. makuwa]|uniref:Disease resistance protein RGA2-like n=1 Tax=Cucumis melo var. makuwa TaxID=1194695 RepID=A0A5D3C5K6_CUCMM|nr:disease resistance protein RGA2-like [Cucumis melo var. makuwa]
MWMAHGFLQPQEGRNVTMENVGDIYFKILLSHCLLEDANETRTRRIEEYKMHDLVHDIAMAISRDQNLQLNPSNILEKEHQKKGIQNVAFGFEKGCKITELGPLKNLQGNRVFCVWRKLNSKEEANGANFAEKENLKELYLNWPMERNDNNGYNDLEVLEGLQPNQNLQSLKILHFAGKHLPNNIFVENLRKINLCGCNSCEKLPMLGQLNNLKELEISSFQGLQAIGNEFYGNDPNQRS